jgi:hypothetical protein
MDMLTGPTFVGVPTFKSGPEAGFLITIDSGTGDQILAGVEGSAFGGYDLTTSIGPVTGTLDPFDGGTFPAIGGSLTLNSFGQLGTFTAAIPELASLTLLGIGAAGLLGYGRRQRRRAAA